MSMKRGQSTSVVLVVEDEALVLMTAVDMLGDAGFTVLGAEDADGALQLLEGRTDIGILFTDVDMPGSMNGFVLVQHVAERWPHIRLVITSGRIRPSNRDVPDAGQFVPKPYMAEQLLAAFEHAG